MSVECKFVNVAILTDLKKGSVFYPYLIINKTTNA